MTDSQLKNSFDLIASYRRCAEYRRRILEVSQQVTALHIGSSYSSVEMVDCIYHGLMRFNDDKSSPDTFLLSKGHGCMIMYVVLESMGFLTREDLDKFCTAEGRLGIHPDYGVPGIHASTGSLGHGLTLSVGMALAKQRKGQNGVNYCVISDGEAQEGSTWEATMMASSLGVNNLVAFMDNNNFQSLGKTSETHPSFYPVVDKYIAFGWECVEVDGHDSQAIYDAVTSRDQKRPLMVVCKTTKGKGVSYMENVPIWHYRSPNPEEYKIALAEIEETLK